MIFLLLTGVLVRDVVDRVPMLNSIQILMNMVSIAFNLTFNLTFITCTIIFIKITFFFARCVRPHRPPPSSQRLINNVFLQMLDDIELSVSYRATCQ
jgi:hypothetical protein